MTNPPKTLGYAVWDSHLGKIAGKAPNMLCFKDRAEAEKCASLLNKCASILNEKANQ